MKISISALSIAYGLTPEALRYYEEKGLLSPDRAASSGFRRFSIADVQRLGSSRASSGRASRWMRSSGF